MKALYLIYGIALCALLAYGNTSGWSVAASVRAGKWGPRGHRAYHK